MMQIEGFNIRLVAKGEAYGRNDRLVHEEQDPMVEFYDSRYDQEDFKGRGQFVSRYYVYTILGMGNTGLCLDGGVPSWAISAPAVREVKRYIRGYLQELV